MDEGNWEEDKAHPSLIVREQDNEWILKIHPRTETEPARIELNPSMAFERAVERFVELVNTRLV